MAASVMTQFARELGKTLAGSGFTGHGKVFRRRSAAGDYVVVELLPVTCYDAAACFAVWVGFALGPKWEFDRERLHLKGEHGPLAHYGVWQREFRPGPDDPQDRYGDQWAIGSAGDIPAVLASLKPRVAQAITEPVRWLDRDYLRSVAESGTLGFEGERILCWLLAEEGPSDELRHLLFGAKEPDDPSVHPVQRGVWEHALRAARR